MSIEDGPRYSMRCRSSLEIETELPPGRITLTVDETTRERGFTSISRIRKTKAYANFRESYFLLCFQALSSFRN